MQDPETGKPLDEDSLIAEFSMLMIAGVVGRPPKILKPSLCRPLPATAALTRSPPRHRLRCPAVAAADLISVY